MSVEAIRWQGNRLELLDQRCLPDEVIYRFLADAPGVAEAIRSMVVRGAPAIGVAAAYGVTLAAQAALRQGRPLEPEVRRAMELLAEARPTAINLRWALDRMAEVLEEGRGLPPELLAARLEAEASQLHSSDLAVNRAIGVQGAPLLERCTGVLTHCNTGALATSGYGTALGVIRQAWADGARFRVFAGETRPFLQGSRLTAWELVRDQIPTTLLIDSAAGSLMARGQVQAVILGADRIAANGDVANKIGTYALAVLAAHHHIPFYVAAPTSSLDPNIPDGSSIPIEMREEREVTHLGGHRVAAAGVEVFNPAFDVTPAGLVTAIITEVGVLRPPYRGAVERAWQAGRAWLRQGVGGG